jgi:hypothetical protein
MPLCMSRCLCFSDQADRQHATAQCSAAGGEVSARLFLSQDQASCPAEHCPPGLRLGPGRDDPPRPHCRGRPHRAATCTRRRTRKQGQAADGQAAECLGQFAAKITSPSRQLAEPSPGRRARPRADDRHQPGERRRSQPRRPAIQAIARRRRSSAGRGNSATGTDGNSAPHARDHR